MTLRSLLSAAMAASRLPMSTLCSPLSATNSPTRLTPTAPSMTSTATRTIGGPLPTEWPPVRKPGMYSKGDITQSEDIADLGGFLATLDAYKDRLQADGYTGETMDEQLRKFYESFAYVWRVQYSDEKLAQFPEKDVHSHARLRTNGVMMNTDLWYDLFGVDRNCKLYLPKERRAYIW